MSEYYNIDDAGSAIPADAPTKTHFQALQLFVNDEIAARGLQVDALVIDEAIGALTLAAFQAVYGDLQARGKALPAEPQTPDDLAAQATAWARLLYDDLHPVNWLLWLGVGAGVAAVGFAGVAWWRRRRRPKRSGRLSGTSKRTRLDLILDRVTPRHEVTIDADGYTREQVDKIYAAAKARGLHVSGTHRWILVRWQPQLRGYGKPGTYRVRAPFLIKNRWQWHTWTESESGGNKHAAVIDKGRKLGAQGWDYGQTTYESIDRANF